MTGIWMNPGQSITCDNNHVIATALNKLLIGVGRLWPTQLEWKIRIPQDGEIAPCPECGSLWVINNYYIGKTWICIDGNWNLPLPYEARKLLIEFDRTKQNVVLVHGLFE